MFYNLELETKHEYRNKAKMIRKSLDTVEISNFICKHIKELGIYNDAKKIAGFYPLKDEIDITPLFQDCSKEWFLPVVLDDENMSFCRYKNQACMEKNKFGIYEPALTKPLKLNDFDIIMIPALLVDKTGHRIGYGKGYYDRFLSKLNQNCLKIIPIPDELLINKIPSDKFDIPVDMAITQSGLYDFIDSFH